MAGVGVAMSEPELLAPPTEAGPNLRRYSSSPETRQKVVEFILEGATKEQAAHMAGASFNTVKYWAKRGWLPSRPQNSWVRFPKKSRTRDRSKTQVKTPRHTAVPSSLPSSSYLFGDRNLHEQVARALVMTAEAIPQVIEPIDLQFLSALRDSGPMGIVVRDLIEMFPPDSRRTHFNETLHRLISQARRFGLPFSDVVKVTLRDREYCYVAGVQIDMVLERLTRQEPCDEEPIPDAATTARIVEVLQTTPQIPAFQVAERLGLTDSAESQTRFHVALKAARLSLRAS